MLEWILKNLSVLVVVVVVIGQMFRAIAQARRARMDQENKRDESAEARRTREVQEEIRRQIAQRRAGEAPGPTFREERQSEPPPVPRPHTTQLPEPLGGPLGRMLEELQKKVVEHTAPPEPPPLVVARNTAEVQRQEQIAEELRLIEESRVLAARRAAQLAATARAEEQSQRALLAAARARLLGDLRDPESLRRAFVLREVLGTPVGLR